MDTTIKTPSGLPGIIQTFGYVRSYILPDGTLSQKWEDEMIDRIPIRATPYAFDPSIVITRITVHKLLADHAQAMYNEIAERGLWLSLGPYGGGFEFRANKNNSAKISTHAWGIAWDWNPIAFPNGSSKKRDPDLAAIIRSYGFVMGEDFHETKDPMHFQLCSNY